MTRVYVLIVLSLFAGGCHYAVEKVHGVVGSGVHKVEKRELSPFTAVSTDGAFEIELVCQQPQAFEIEGDDNLLALVSTEVSGGVLHIGNVSSYSNRTPIKIKISVPNIEGITANGAGTIEVSRLKNDKFDVHSNGAPTIRVSGETKELKIDANGAGTVDTHKLKALQAEVGSRGVAKVEVFASDVLNITVSGPSQVIYDGDPAVNQTVNGPGSVQKRESGGA